jgi:tartrate-resistant acid phosphatase type 5
MIPFLAIGDFGSGYYEQIKVAKSLNHYKIDFICGLGDNIYEHGVSSENDEQFYTKFEKPYSKLSDKIKWYMCVGNHDYGNKLNIMFSNRQNFQVDYTKYSNKWVMPNLYYHYQKKRNNITIDFIVLDTNINYMNYDEINKQKKYIKKKLKECNGDWIIAYGHHPWRSIGYHGNSNGDDKLENFFKDIFSEIQPDIYMSGHDHSKQYIQKSYKNKNISLIVSGAGGKTNYGEEFEINNMFDCDLFYASNNLGIAYFKCYKNKIILEFYDENNLLEYSNSIFKKI